MKNITRRAALSLALSLAATAIADANEPTPGGTVTGRVVDTDGKPVAGATVGLVRRLEAPPWSVKLTTTTNADGRYRFDAVPPWTWELEWEKEHATTLSKDTQAGFWRQKVATTVAVLPGLTATVADVSLRLWMTLRLSVRLPGNLPAVNRTLYQVVFLPTRGGGCMHFPTGGTLRELQTDARGVCFLPIDLLDKPAKDDSRSELLRFADPATGSFAYVLVRSNPGATANVSVPLVKPAMISGTLKTPDGAFIKDEPIFLDVDSAMPNSELLPLLQAISEATNSSHSGEKISLHLKSAEVYLRDYVGYYPFLVKPLPKEPLISSIFPAERGDRNGGILVGECQLKTGERFEILFYDECKTDAEGRFCLVLLPGLQYSNSTLKMRQHGNAAFAPLVLSLRGGQTVENAVLLSP